MHKKNKVGRKNSDAGIAEVRSGSFTLFFLNTYKVKIPVWCYVTVVTEFRIVRGQGGCYVVNCIFPTVIFMLQVPVLPRFYFCSPESLHP